MELGKKIPMLRSQNNRTQQQLTERLYVSKTTVSKWQNGKGFCLGRLLSVAHRVRILWEEYYRGSIISEFIFSYKCNKKAGGISLKQSKVIT